MTFTQAGLALGRGTILAEFERKGRAVGGLALDGTEARLLSLLMAAYREPLAGGVIEKIRRAGEIWRAGDKALAQIHLAFLGLRRSMRRTPTASSSPGRRSKKAPARAN